MRETVRDSHGNIIYQDNVHRSPHETDAERGQRIIGNESELGW